ncbi:hypothetical protein POG22_12035 [Geitlerinema sp. CS-897]|nr:hypothetical protein [Geitlerinema sp. CS-897]
MSVASATALALAFSSLTTSVTAIGSGKDLIRSSIQLSEGRVASWLSKPPHV